MVSTSSGSLQGEAWNVPNSHHQAQAVWEGREPPSPSPGALGHGSEATVTGAAGGDTRGSCRSRQSPAVWGSARWDSCPAFSSFAVTLSSLEAGGPYPTVVHFPSQLGPRCLQDAIFLTHV